MMMLCSRIQFSQTDPIKPGTTGYRADPELKDKMHVVVFVIDGCNANLLSGDIVDKLKTMRVLSNQRGESGFTVDWTHCAFFSFVRVWLALQHAVWFAFSIRTKTT